MTAASSRDTVNIATASRSSSAAGTPTLVAQRAPAMPINTSHAIGRTDTPLIEDTIGHHFEAIARRFPQREVLVSRHQGQRLSLGLKSHPKGDDTVGLGPDDLVAQRRRAGAARCRRRAGAHAGDAGAFLLLLLLQRTTAANP